MKGEEVHGMSCGQRLGMRTDRKLVLFNIGGISDDAQCIAGAWDAHVQLWQLRGSACDRLVVGLNTDRSVRALKGAPRPIIPEQERARVPAALGCVDAIVLFDEDTPLNLIKSLRPEILAKGGDYAESQVVGAEEVKAWNGRVSLMPFVPVWSSTEIIKKIEASKPAR